MWTDFSEYTDQVQTQSLQRPWEALGNSTLIAFLSTALAVLFGSVLASYNFV